MGLAVRHGPYEEVAASRLLYGAYGQEHTLLLRLAGQFHLGNHARQDVAIGVVYVYAYVVGVSGCIGNDSLLYQSAADLLAVQGLYGQV